MARLEAGNSVYQLKKTLEKPKMGRSGGLTVKCKIAEAKNPSAFCLVEEEEEEVPLGGAKPFGASTDSVGVPGESTEQRRDSESLHSDPNGHCNCEHHKHSAGAHEEVSTLRAGLLCNVTGGVFF